MPVSEILGGVSAAPEPVHEHAHSHHLGRARGPLDGPLRVVLPALVGALVVATAIGLVALWPDDQQVEDVFTDGGTFQVEFVDGTVRSVEDGPCPGTDPSAGATCTLLEVEVTSGPTAAGEGEEPTLASIQQVPTSAAADAGVGDAVVLGYTPDSDPGFQYYFADFQRRTPLVLLTVLFGVAVVALGRWQGVRALIALGLSLVVIVGFVLPSILDGNPPVLVALVGTSAVAFVALFLTHGVNHGTAVAFLGTMASLGLTGLLAVVFVELTTLTGLASEEATFLQVGADQLDLQGLLLAGIVIGTLGVLDDVTVTQVAAVEEIHAADPSASPRRTWAAAMRVGRDHIGSTVNTLVLAYAGASLPLLLLFTQTTQPLSQVLNGEVVASEVVRTLVGSIGLVASVPLTTGLAVWVARSRVHPALGSEVRAVPADASPDEEPSDLASDERAAPADVTPDPAPAPADPEPEPEPEVAPPPASWDDFAPRDDPELP
jgi:uncharacterized membrane protein